MAAAAAAEDLVRPGGRCAARPSSGRAQAGGDPALQDGVRRRRSGGVRTEHSAALAKVSAVSPLTSTTSIPTSAVAAIALPARYCPNTAAPMRSTFVPSNLPTAGRSPYLPDRNVPRETRETVLHSVCVRFTTVLGPGSDGYHEDHIHLDLMERHNDYRICQWNVWGSAAGGCADAPRTAAAGSAAARGCR